MIDEAGQVQSQIGKTQRLIEDLGRKVVESQGDDMSHYKDLQDDLHSAEKKLSALLKQVRFLTRNERFILD